MDKPIYMVFDVESLGLHGMAFAYGFVVVDSEGNELDSGYAAYKPDLKALDAEPKDYLNTNVLPALYGYTHDDLISLCYAFWYKWLEWKQKGARLVSDVAWPVETGFLSGILALIPNLDPYLGPYPLIDVSSVLLAAGQDPVGNFERGIGESPAHNPLCDARQSARVFIQAMKELQSNG